MKYTFVLEEVDYLTHQLFISSTSKPSLNRRRKSWIFVTGAFALLAFLSSYKGDDSISNNFIIASIASLILYPFFIRWKYKRHFKKHIKEHLSNALGKKMTFEFNGDHFMTNDEENSESKISYGLTQSLHELPEHFLIRLNNGQSLILPKNKISEITKLKSDLSELAKKRNLEIQDNTNWNWNKSW